MESIEKINENYAIVFNVNLIRATLNEASDFKDYLSEAISDTEKDIIVNLSACEHLDSTFLGVLVSSYKKLKSQSRSLVIIEPIDQSSIFLTLNSIGKIFPLYTSVKVALEDIENKRLLEKEINELTEEKSEVSFEEIEKKSTDDSAESIQEESLEIEPQLQSDSLVQDQNVEDVFSLQAETEELESELNLVEHQDFENKFNDITSFNTEDEAVEETNNHFDSQMQEVSELNKAVDENVESEVETTPFGDSVKWEFGFSS